MNPRKTNVKTLTDKELYACCKEYGQNARLWRRRFAGLLPEVFRRGLYRRRKFGSIYEFAAKLGCMSKVSVDKVLQISSKLEDKPELKTLLESGAQGWSKLERVAYVATPQTDSYWAETVQALSSPALSGFVQNFRLKSPAGGGFQPVKYAARSVVHGAEGVVPYKEEVRLEVSSVLLAKKLQRISKRADFEQLLEKFVAEVEEHEEAEKQTAVYTSSRPVPAKMDRFVRERTGGLCAFPSCTKKGTSLHHTQRWALENVHDPDRLHLLCLIHERLAHSGMIENEEQSPEHWRLREYSDPIGPKAYIDSLVNLHRGE